MSVLFIGQAPARSAEPGARALSGAVGLRMADMSGVTLEKFLAKVRTTNVLPAWTGKQGKGDRFDMADARAAAMAITCSDAFFEAQSVVFVGFRVAAAFGRHELKPCRWAPGWLMGQRAALLPHPSGINTWYNDPDNKAAAARFMRKIWRTM